jgi:hypothetical protein
MATTTKTRPTDAAPASAAADDTLKDALAAPAADSQQKSSGSRSPSPLGPVGKFGGMVGSSASDEAH